MASGILNSTAAGPGEPAGIIVPTVLNISRDELAYWQNITCLYNKDWYIEQDRVTLPFCFFHITKMTENWQNDTSKKRVILYEPPAETDSKEDMSSPVREGAMQTITDNIVLQPKTYQVEAIVPFQPVGRYIMERAGFKRPDGSEYGGSWGRVVNSLPALVGQMTREENDYLDAQFETVRKKLDLGVKAQAAVVKHMTGERYEESTIDSSGAGMVNKMSLEAMADSGKILIFKSWDGYDYRYVVMTELAVEKVPLEDDVFRATFRLQEMPVLSVAPVEKEPVEVSRAWVVGVTDALQPLSGITESTPAVEKEREKAGAEAEE
jgi:hypothetical protein